MDLFIHFIVHFEPYHTLFYYMKLQTNTSLTSIKKNLHTTFLTLAMSNTSFKSLLCITLLILLQYYKVPYNDINVGVLMSLRPNSYQQKQNHFTFHVLTQRRYFGAQKVRNSSTFEFSYKILSKICTSTSS